MISIKASGFQAVSRKMNRLASGDARKAVLVGLEQTARMVEREVKMKFSGDPIKVRSGLTRASIRTQMNPARLEGRVGSPMKHIGTLEDGATITPKRAKLLTIPLKAALTSAGKSRGGARQIGMKFARTFWMKGKGSRNPILYGVRSGGKQLVPLFVGVKRVVIRARHPFAKVAAWAGLPMVRNIERELGKAIKR